LLVLANLVIARINRSPVADQRSPTTTMSIYTFALALGAAGLALMGLSGFTHVFGTQNASHGHGSGHAGHHLSHGRGAMHVRAGVHVRGGIRGGGSRLLWALLSPRPLFSAMLGFGVVGSILESHMGGAPLAAAAVTGGLAFELFLVRPLWNFLFRFETAPALTLEHSIGDVARAATSFDGAGNGLVALELDGQIVQVLGSLRREDREAGVRVRAGDQVQIDDVDAERNRCTVRPLGM
jgi:hypothetical protein